MRKKRVKTMERYSELSAIKFQLSDRELFCSQSYYDMLKLTFHLQC